MKKFKIALALVVGLCSFNLGAGFTHLTPKGNAEAICRTIEGKMFKVVGPAGAFEYSGNSLVIRTVDYEYIFPSDHCNMRILRK